MRYRCFENTWKYLSYTSKTSITLVFTHLLTEMLSVVPLFFGVLFFDLQKLIEMQRGLCVMVFDWHILILLKLK